MHPSVNEINDDSLAMGGGTITEKIIFSEFEGGIMLVNYMT